MTLSLWVLVGGSTFIFIVLMFWELEVTRHETCKDCGHFVCTCNAKKVKGTRNHDTLTTDQAKYVDPKTIQSARTVKTKDGKVEVIVHYKKPKRGILGRKKK